MRRVLAMAPASFAVRLFLLCNFAALCDRCSLYERVRSDIVPILRMKVAFGLHWELRNLGGRELRYRCLK